MAGSIPPRSKVNKKHTWNAESVFKNTAAWEKEIASILEVIPNIKKHQGNLTSAENLLTALKDIDDIMARIGKVFVYAGFAYSVDTTDQKAAAMSGKAQGVFGQVLAAISFIRPEMLQIGKSTLNQWTKENKDLAYAKQFIDDLFRRQEHVRSGEVEEVLGMLADPFGGASHAQSLLTNAEFKFRPGVNSKGKKVEVNEGTIWDIMAQPDRKARKTAWESYLDKHLEFKSTLASHVETSIKQNVFFTRARKFDTALEATLHNDNIPTDVFHSLIDTFKKNLPVWHRYFEIRRKALGVSKLAPYDMWAPLTKKRTKVTYNQAVDWICEGLAPMGEDYVSILRKGCLQDRWVDIYPNQGKRTGAFSWGTQGTHPFIMMSYNDDVFGLSTLAHELGHSMHSYLTWQNQPPLYSDYSLFAAEVASNFHQAMVRGYLLEKNKDKNFQISLIEEAMANFFRYFFIMPTLARFELETHTLVENGQSLTSDMMIKIMSGLFAEGYGSKVLIDQERVGMTWAYFQHLFSDYYVFQYATGISGAHALSARILRAEKNAVQDYRKFLNAGSSMYPLDALKMAGVDLTTSKPVEETFAVMTEYIDRLEKLVK